MKLKDINNAIETNLKDFYFSFKKGKNNSFFENEYIKSIYSSWPSFVMLKQENPSFEKVINSIKNKENLSKNWILSDKYVKNNKQSIKNEKLFPVKIWDNMHLFKEELITIKTITNFKVAKLQLDELDEFISIINASVFHKNVLTSHTLESIIENTDFSIYVGKYKNNIVSTCLIFNNGTTNGLYFIATKDIFRGKGFAKNTISVAINEQIIKNEKSFVLHATKLGKGIYTSLGFKAYSKLIIFVKI